MNHEKKWRYFKQFQNSQYNSKHLDWKTLYKKVQFDKEQISDIK